MSELENVVLLNPQNQQTADEIRESQDMRRPEKHARLGWLAPFFMGPINTRVVRRSNALQGECGRPYGPSFRYQESFQTKSWLQAMAMTLGQGIFERLLRSKMGRSLIKRVVPKPGEGPSQTAIEGGFFRCKFVDESDDGDEILITLYTDGDPGNRVTVTALCESALALAEDDLSELSHQGGILTPTTGLGDRLLDRLKRAGWQIKISERGGASA